MNIEQTLQRFQAAPIRHIQAASLMTDDALQPRDGRIVPLREQQRIETRSAEHIGTMLLALRASNDIHLEPLLVAEIDGGLFVVDGHHRLRAYERADRETVPARVMPMDRRMAVLVSKLVNCSERSLEMHAEQKREAAWQYLASVTRLGVLELPIGASLRTVAGRFGVSKDTIANMLRKLPKVQPKGFPAEKCDPGTGFPRWKAVRDWRNQTDDDAEEQAMSAEHWTQREAIRVARKLGMLETGTTPEAWRLALQMYADEAKREAHNADNLAFLADIAEPSTGDY